jgi:Mn-containing catalase
MFQAFAIPAEKEKIRQFLMETATEELGHIEMLATAVSKNLEGSSEETRDDTREDAIIHRITYGNRTSTRVTPGIR